MNDWRCGELGCLTRASGTGPAIGLRAIGWEVREHHGSLIVGAGLRCPRCSKRSASRGQDMATPEGRQAVALELSASHARSLVPSGHEGQTWHGSTDDGTQARCFLVIQFEAAILIVCSTVTPETCEVVDLLLVDKAEVETVLRAAATLGWVQAAT